MKTAFNLLLFGGRGASSASGGGASGGADVPRLNNPAGIPSNAITEEEYLALKGVGDAMSGYTVDKLRGNKNLKTQKGQEAFNKATLNAGMSHQEAREAARAEYQKLIDSGKIRDKTAIEKTITKAHGHPDNASTQAARRMCEKRGIDWRTGKKLKKKK